MPIIVNDLVAKFKKEGGMFGINDNTQTSNPKPADSAPMMQGQPFSSTSPSSVPVAPESPSLSTAPALHEAAAPGSASSSVDDDLMDLKQQALQSLQPLVSHLDQTPEEKFKTTMMLIQATDNPDLVSQAYDAANQITDEKAKAQALLDVVNEINYFTQKQKKN